MPFNCDDHETLVTPSGGVFHLWHKPTKAAPIPQSEIGFVGADDFALVPERGIDAERAQAEAREREESDRARIAFEKNHQTTLF